MFYPMLQRFLPEIITLKNKQPLTKCELLSKSFLLEKDRDLELYYAPHNEYVNKEAKIVIVGITPGWKQMKTAFEQFISSSAANGDLETCLRESKMAAAFTGTMRTNLCQMLDHCGIQTGLHIPDSSSLFNRHHHYLHTTSIIKYPVFFQGKNYTGHRPTIQQSPLLQQYVYEEFPKELVQITPPALVIPLGKIVEQIILKLIRKHKIPHHLYLMGFPHPSGANGHRLKQFQQQKQLLREKVKEWMIQIR